MVHVWWVSHHCAGWCDMFLGNGQFLQIYLDMPWWDLLLCWGVEVSDLEGSVWLIRVLWWVSSAAPTSSSGGSLHSWVPQCQVWHMMGVWEWLVLVCMLCTIMSVDGLQLFVLWESSLLLYPVFQTGVSWIHCKLSGMLWMTSVLLVNHQCWYIWGTAIRTSDISTVSGSAPLLCPLVSHSVWGNVCRTTVTTPTSSQWGSSSVPTSLTFFCLPPLLWCLGALSLGPLCPLRHLGFQCPFFPHLWHMSSHAGHDDWPGGWDFVQCPHEYTLSSGGFLPWWGLFCFLMALTVFCSFNPMASRLSQMAICVQHTSSILGVVAVRSSVSSFLMSSLSLRALTSLYWMFHSFSSSEGKLHQSARAWRWSTSSSGDCPGQMQISSSW